jgi:hypothetical protein
MQRPVGTILDGSNVNLVVYVEDNMLVPPEVTPTKNGLQNCIDLFELYITVIEAPGYAA